ncbi:hypothetical protein [Streptomyces prasinopilosus]|uniref:hypothetical protein n=1 Tax=Streptomyces prasinopilosus TaxID=67344 RepID=UPI0006EB5544|nr:hypothetical protein [Streptomyces prasinopilosus]
MSIQTITPITDPYRSHPDYYRGRADAYDDSQTRTVDQMVVLASMAIDHASIPYAFGYSDRVTELRLEQDAVAPMEMELAQTWLARTQGRAA